MKMSYKIALIVSVVVCILAFAVFKGERQPEPTQAANTPTDQADAPAERKTLRADSKGDGSLKSMVNAKTPASNNGTTGSLASDARSRVLASLNADQPEADTQTAQAAGSHPANDPPTASPLGSGASGRIALARTGPGATKPEPATKINRQALDAALGTSDRSIAARSSVKPTSTEASTATATKTTASNPTADSPGTYVVQPGDTFSSIAIKLYNDERRWVDISQANFVDPTRLKVGQVLRLPDANQTLSREEPVPPGPSGIQTYTIRPGDSLSTVAQTYYGDPTLWRTIYNFNRDKIGDNPNAIQAGMTLKVPPKLSNAR